MNNEYSLILAENMPINLIYQSFPHGKSSNRSKKFESNLILNNFPSLKKADILSINNTNFLIGFNKNKINVITFEKIQNSIKC